MTKEELMKKIEKEEKWLIHALNDQTDVTSQYSVDIAFDAVKHYVKDYIDSQQKMGRWIEDDMTYCGVGLVNYKCDKCGEMGGSWRKGLKPDKLPKYCMNCGVRMEAGE